MTDDLVVLEARITYQTQNSWSPLPLASIARYRVWFSDSSNAESVLIPPTYSEFTFPVVARRGQSPVLHWDTASLVGGGHINVSKVTWRQLTGLTDTEMESLFEGYFHPN